MKRLILLPLFSLGIAAGLHAEEAFFGLPPAKGAKPDLARLAGIIDADIFKDPPVRPADVAANPNAWDGILIASGAKVKPELPVKSEANGAKEIPRPADLKGTLTTWLKKIETE